MFGLQGEPRFSFNVSVILRIRDLRFIFKASLTLLNSDSCDLLNKIKKLQLYMW